LLQAALVPVSIGLAAGGLIDAQAGADRTCPAVVVTAGAAAVADAAGLDPRWLLLAGASWVLLV
jgi:hypothetical protein